MKMTILAITTGRGNSIEMNLGLDVVAKLSKLFASE
jgi:hypothetical protein